MSYSEKTYQYNVVNSRIPILTITPIDELVIIYIDFGNKKFKDVIFQETVFNQYKYILTYPWMYYENNTIKDIVYEEFPSVYAFYMNKQYIHNKRGIFNNCTFKIVGRCTIKEDFKCE